MYDDAYFAAVDLEEKYTRYHEAGHAVIQHLYGFRPVCIDGASSHYDRRTSAFLRAWRPCQSPRTRERAMDYALMCVAGPAAQARVSDRNLYDLRGESNQPECNEQGLLGDYRCAYLLLERVAYRCGLEISEAVLEAHLLLLEQRAIALMNRPDVWAAVESVAAELELAHGYVAGKELVAAICRGPFSKCVALPEDNVKYRIDEATRASEPGRTDLSQQLGLSQPIPAL